MQTASRAAVLPGALSVKRGSKVIVQGESRVLATPQQLIVLPADVELEVINQPENGLFAPICYR